MFEQICYFLRATSEWERIYKGFPLCSKFLSHLVTGYLSLSNLQKRAMRQTTWKSERSEPLELACFGTSIINKSTWKFKHSSSPPRCNHDVLLTKGKILGRPIRRLEYDDIKVTLQTWKKNGELKMTSKHWLDVLPVWAYLPLARIKTSSTKLSPHSPLVFKPLPLPNYPHYSPIMQPKCSVCFDNLCLPETPAVVIDCG